MTIEYTTNPVTKTELLDRILSQTFNGDLRTTAAEGTTVKVERIKPFAVRMTFQDQYGGPDRVFLLYVRKPKPMRAVIAARRRFVAQAEDGHEVEVRVGAARVKPAAKIKTTPPRPPVKAKAVPGKPKPLGRYGR